MHPQHLSDHNKKNQGESSLFVEVGISVLFINSNISKNKKTQKVKKLTF